MGIPRALSDSACGIVKGLELIFDPVVGSADPATSG